MFKPLACVVVVVVVISITVVCPCESASNDTKLYLLGLFPMTGAWAGGEALLLASQLAVRDINANPNVLPGFQLVMLPKDTSCDGGKATDEMYKELYNSSTTKMMILGGGCSTATEPTAQASHHWNLMQISFTSTSPKLSQRDSYPRFFRLISTLSMHNVFKIALFREFNWRKVATLHQSVDLFTLSMADFHMDASKAGIEILGAESFVDNPITQVGNIKQLGARIIIGGFYSNMARRVFCAAYHQQLYGAKYVWILPDGKIVSTGMMDPTNGKDGPNQLHDIVWDGYQPVQWQAGAPPIDFRIERQVRQTIQPSLFVTGVVFAAVGVSMACAFLAFNIHFRKLRVIKMSSPNINNLMLIGGMLAYLSIIFLGIDTAIVSTETFLWMCKARTWCLSIGFSMAFGSMFSKTWRVHKIFTNKTALKTVVKDFRLVSFVASLVLVDVLLVVLWETFDPLQAKEKHGLEKVDDENDDIIYTPVRIMCESAHQIYWIGAFYVIDGLLLVFGAFLAWETRTVSIQALNDSKFIGVCIYNILIFSVIGAPISFVLEDRDALYALVAGLIWLATTLTLCVIFIPKIKMRNTNIRPVHNTMDSANTLTKERQIRNLVDVQKDELQLLRQEILQLKLENKKLSPGRTDQELVGDPNLTGDTLVTKPSPSQSTP